MEFLEAIGKVLLENGESIGGLATAFAGVGAIVTFRITRKSELAWKRTEFIVQQSAFLDNDSEMRECTLILYGKHPSLNVRDFLILAEEGSSEVDLERAQLLGKMEKFLNFLWRIAYAHLVLKTLTKNDLNAFGAYFGEVEEHEKLREYCLKQGYEEIIYAAAILGPSQRRPFTYASESEGQQV